MTTTTFAFLYLSSIVAVAVIADRRGRSGVGWFFMGCFLTPVFALGFLLCLTRKYSWEDQMRQAGMLPPPPQPKPSTW